MFPKVNTRCAHPLVTLVMPNALGPAPAISALKMLESVRFLLPADRFPVPIKNAISAKPATAAPVPTKVGFVSLGCPKNLVDSEVMMGMLVRVRRAVDSVD